MNKILLLSFFFATLYLPLQAGVVSLTPAEMTQLQQLVATSPEASAWAQTFEKRAENDLKTMPHPIDSIQTAGQLQGTEAKTRTEEAMKDMGRLKNLEWAYVFTGRKDFEAQAQNYVLAWAQTCQPPDNPINATNLEPIIETYDLVRADMPPTDQTKVDNWLRLVADTLFGSDDLHKKNHINNWQAHRLKIIGMAAFTLGDAEMEQKVLDEFKALLEVNLNTDGTTYDFLERDALHYHVYDLEPMTRLSMIYTRAQGLDLYRYKTGNNGSIAQCVAFLVPFAKGDKTHAEYVHTQVKFDIQRAQNHEKGHGIGELFDPKASQKCLELAQFYEPGLQTLVGQLTGQSGAYPSFQILVNSVIRPAAPTTTPQP